ncbi:hypothetical protein KFK09_015458 [Dendrobium nobile]|uniref:Uncharacterized protein n=1 Tax=Dendrobium nobile TaxID=94219 RepID=A0A8T3BAK7_DENNO|nr:hypothetical protein KFK09_015458 [Dendrobium nobile]
MLGIEGQDINQGNLAWSPMEPQMNTSNSFRPLGSKKVEIQVVGVVENMSGLRQPALDLKFERMVTGEKGTAVLIDS